MVLIRGAGIAIGERDNEVAADVLNIERRVVIGKAGDLERVFVDLALVVAVDAMKPAVKDLDATALEICGIEPRAIVRLSNGYTLVDRLLRAIHFQDGIRTIHVWVPRGNGSVFG